MASYKYAVTGNDRKRLAGAISEILNTPLHYLGAPTFAYEIGDYRIERDGTVIGEYSLELMMALEQRGFEYEIDPTFHLITPRGTLLCQKRFDTASEAKVEGYENYFHHDGRDVFIKTDPDGMTEHSKHFAVVGAPFEKPKPMPDPEPESEIDLLSISYPMEGFTEQGLENLHKLVMSKAPLIKKALGIEELPVECGEDEISFPWFEAPSDGDTTLAYTQFITALCKTAKEKKRVTAKAPDTFENEKFTMRVWLVGMGMKGDEYKLSRKLLLKNLDGDASWRYGKPEKDKN